MGGATAGAKAAAVVALAIELDGLQAGVRVIITGEQATSIGVEGITALLIKAGMVPQKARLTAAAAYIALGTAAGIKTGSAADNLNAPKSSGSELDKAIAELQDRMAKNADNPPNSIDDFLDKVQKELDDGSSGATVAPNSTEKGVRSLLRIISEAWSSIRCKQ